MLQHCGTNPEDVSAVLGADGRGIEGEPDDVVSHLPRCRILSVPSGSAWLRTVRRVWVSIGVQKGL